MVVVVVVAMMSRLHSKCCCLFIEIKLKSTKLETEAAAAPTPCLFFIFFYFPTPLALSLEGTLSSSCTSFGAINSPCSRRHCRAELPREDLPCCRTQCLLVSPLCFGCGLWIPDSESGGSSPSVPPAAAAQPSTPYFSPSTAVCRVIWGFLLWDCKEALISYKI